MVCPFAMVEHKNQIDLQSLGNSARMPLDGLPFDCLQAILLQLDLLSVSRLRRVCNGTRTSAPFFADWRRLHQTVTDGRAFAHGTTCLAATYAVGTPHARACMAAAGAGDLELLKWLSPRASCLSPAALCGRLSVVEWVLRDGDDISEKVRGISNACIGGHEQCLRSILSATPAPSAPGWCA
jgi:hypothetical protein